MRGKLNIGLIVVMIILIILNVFQFFFWKNLNDDTAKQYTAEISNLNATIAGYGEEVTCYTVTAAVKAGDEITEDSIEEMKTYSSLLTEQYITDLDSILGRYYKVALNPGTPIFTNCIMDEELDDTNRDRDIVLDHMTVGLQEGDYIDVRITMPYGDDYIVLSHKRVYGIHEESIKLYLNEVEWNTYQGALIDYFLNQEYGCTIYADKYVEPGLQVDAVPYYAVPTNIAALMQRNPNVLNKEAAASLTEWRESLEELLVIFRDNDDTVDADGGRFAQGRTSSNDAIENDRKAQREEEEANDQAQQDAESMVDDDEYADDFWDEPATMTEGEEDTEQ